MPKKGLLTPIDSVVRAVAPEKEGVTQTNLLMQ